MKKVIVKRKWTPRMRIPADVDPIALADKLKGDLTAEWLKRRAALRKDKLKSAKFYGGKLKSLLVQ